MRFSKNCLEKCDSDWLSGWQFTALSKLVVLKNVHVKKIPTGLQIKMSKWNNGITRHVATDVICKDICYTLIALFRSSKFTRVLPSSVRDVSTVLIKSKTPYQVDLLHP